MLKNIFVTDISNYFTEIINISFLINKVIKKETLETKKEYLEILFQDKKGIISGIIWSENIRNEYFSYSNKVVAIQAFVIKDDNENYQLIVNSMSLLEEYNIADYIYGISQEDTKKYMQLINNYIKIVKIPAYRSLLENIFTNITESVFQILPATLNNHHNYNGGFLVHTVGVTCLACYMVNTLSKYNIHPSYSLPYNNDLIITGGLLHCIGNIYSLKNFPNMHKIEESLLLNLYELTMQYIYEKVLTSKNTLSLEEKSILYHIIGCVYNNTDRTPMIREGILLRQAVDTQISISNLEYCIANQEQSNTQFFSSNNIYIYIPEGGIK